MKWLLAALGACIVALLFFLAGFAAGERHAGRERGEGFAPPFMPGGFSLPNGFVTKGHGAAGTVETVSLPTVEMKERDGDTVTVTVASGTPISGGMIAPGQFIVVIGDPASTGTEDIDARFVRIMTPPPSSDTTNNNF